MGVAGANALVANSIGGQVCFAGALEARISAKDKSGQIELTFDLSGPHLDEAMMANGQMPLPPYIASKRVQDARDEVDYQTIYASQDGAVAAPTAGLHFSEQVFSKLDDLNISRHFVTLHVGAGTFLPVKVDDTNDHEMHLENGIVDKKTACELNQLRNNGRAHNQCGDNQLAIVGKCG